MFKQINSTDPRYLAATDILIGDMSDINYEFLLFNKPIILLANEWLVRNFPDIGIKTDLSGLENAIKRSMENPDEFKEQRKYWLKKTIYKPDGNSSDRVIDTVIEYSHIEKPFILLIHGNNEVLKTHIDPLYRAMKKRNINGANVSFFDSKLHSSIVGLVCISAHNRLLKDIPCGYKVHLDHGVKGVGASANFEIVSGQYKEMNYFPGVDLHITEGEISYEKTKKLLGSYKNRALMVGYPKADVLLELNNNKNKISVCKEFGFESDKTLITYAPAGKYNYPFKRGASLSNRVIKKLIKIALNNDDIDILVKLKYPQLSIFKKVLNKLLKR